MLTINVAHARPDTRNPGRPLREHEGLSFASLAELTVNAGSRGHPLSPVVSMRVALLYKTRRKSRLNASLGAVTFDFAQVDALDAAPV
eukprot:6009396-Pyramimonas_sp.AAC.1